MAAHSVKDVVNQAQSMGESSSVDVSAETPTSNGAGTGDEVQDSGKGASNDDAHAVADNNISKPNEENAPDANKNGARDPSTASEVAGPNRQEHAQEHSGDRASSDIVNGVETASYTGSEDAAEITTSRLESSTSSDNKNEDETWRERSNSIAKKPTAFKSVSVTKNYLAKSGAAVPAMLRSSGVMDKPAPGQAAPAIVAAKPRLVAKLGKDARLSLISPSIGVAGGPDASKVWNKNKPAPPQVPKQFTDEELKQQYGIHLATRLQADEASKDGKWADIDDDEDDWAPEPVQWTDGTKSTITPDAAPAPTPPKMDTSTSKSVLSKSVLGGNLKPATPSVQPTSISSAGKTILRPSLRLSSSTAAAAQPRSGRTAPENPAPVSRPVQTSQKGSPWAPLPPVDKASPVTFVPPSIPSARSPLGRQMNASAIDEGPLHPAKEIAADDFDRSWRENERTSQTLFNSNSGRYEPVKATRRMSRNEAGGARPAAVLSRPGGQQQAADADGASNSHKVTGRNQAGEGVLEKRGSGAGLDNEKAAKTGETQPHDASSPSGQFTKPAPPSSSSQPFSAAPASSSIPIDLLAQQKALMSERNATARRRKQEEADREEAARKERIAQRLAALDASTKAIADSKKPVSEDSAANNNSGAASMSTQEPISILSHQPSSATTTKDKALSPNEQPFSINAQPVEPTSTSSLPLIPSSVSPNEPNLAKSQSEPVVSQSLPDESAGLPGLGHSVHHDRNQARWNTRAPPQQHDNAIGGAQWTTRNIHQSGMSSAGNVWGPVNNERPLGNGSFHSTTQNGPHNVPAPIGSNLSPGLGFQSSRPTSSAPMHFNENLGSQQNHINQAQVNRGHSDFSAQGRQMQSVQSTAGGQAAAAWQSFPSQVDQHDEKVKEQRQEINDILFRERIEARKKAGVQDPTRSQIEESFHKVVAGDLGIRRKNAMEEAAAADTRKMADAAAGITIEGSGLSHRSPLIGSQGSPLHPNTNGRSRFFGAGADRTPTLAGFQQQPLQSDPVRYRKSSSPPPPETGDHPVYGERTSTTVRFPQPKTIIKLPPPPTASATSLARQATPVQMPSSSYAGGNGPGFNWQNRFNSLFTGRSAGIHTPNSPEKSFARPVPQPISSSSKVAYMDATSLRIGAIVSLPAKSEMPVKVVGVPSLPETFMETKPGDDKLMEDREFGSLPIIKVLKTAHPNEVMILSPMPAVRLDIHDKERRDESVFRTSLEPRMLDGYQQDRIEIHINIRGKKVSSKTLVRSVATAAPVADSSVPDHTTINAVNPLYDPTRGIAHARRGGAVSQRRTPMRKPSINPSKTRNNGAAGTTNESKNTDGNDGNNGKRQSSSGAPTGPRQKHQKRGGAARNASSRPSPATNSTTAPAQAISAS